MRAGKNFILEKLTFLENLKKYQADFLFKIWFFEYYKGLRESIFPKKNYFLFFAPWIFLWKYGLVFEPKAKKLLVPHIVPTFRI